MPAAKRRPANRPPSAKVALDKVPPLTDRQRAKVLDHYAKHPNSGYKAAVAAAGINATRAAAKAAIVGDDELRDAPLEALHVDEQSAFQAIGEILSDPDHKDRLRAATWAASALHGHREKSETAVTGPEGGPLAIAVEDRSASFDDVLEVLQQARAIDKR